MKSAPRVLLVASLMLIVLAGISQTGAQTETGTQTDVKPRLEVPPDPKALEMIDAAKNAELGRVEELVKADSALVNARDENGWTPLHWASRGVFRNLARYLVENGADVNARDADGLTPLHWAAVMADTSMVRLLLDHGADPSLADKDGDTPLNLAAARVSRGITDILLDKEADVDVAGNKGLMLLQIAARNGMPRLFRAIVNKGAQHLFADAEANHWTMQDAVSGGSVQIVEALLAKGVLLEKGPDVYGWTPIHYAASAGRLAMIQFLAQKGIDIDARTKAGETAFNLAQANGDKDSQELIIRLGGKTAPQLFPLLKRPYMGQKPPGMIPEIFAPGIVSRPEIREMSITFAPDGKEFYFYRSRGFDKSKIFGCRVVNGAWTPPEETPFSGAFPAALPFMPSDGRRLFFTWQNPESETDPAIWFVEKTEAGWSEPQFAGQGMYMSQSRDGQIYTTDMSSHNTEGKAYVARVTLDGSRFAGYGRLLLSSPSGIAAHPCIAPDGSYVIYDEGGGDHLLLSFKGKDGKWGQPVDLTKHGFLPLAGIPSVSPDGKYLFFKQGCRGALDFAHSDTNRDIWWVDIKVIQNLRPKGTR